MSSHLNPNRHKKKQKLRTSYVWAGIMAVCALAAIFAAVWVVITVYEKIAGDSSEWVLESSTEETTELEVETEEIYGWVTDEGGSRYRENDGTFAIDTWKVWEGKLYYLKEDGYMAVEEIKKEGQVFSFESDGSLKDIQLDAGWRGLTGEDNLQNLDSLVKGHEFWSYLSSDPGSTGTLKPICYRKTTETKEQFLGGDYPELSSKNSLQIHDGYIYYLPQVTGQAYSSLEEKEKNLLNKLFRMRPGESQKELLAENATGYLVIDNNTIYYASSGEIKKAETGTFYSVGSDQYQVQVRDDGCYLLDSMGNLAAGNEEGIQVIGGREYYLQNGKITNVYPGKQSYGNSLFTLEEDPQNTGKKAIYRQDPAGQKVKAAQAPYGIDSFCIAEDYLYYSAFVEQKEDGTRYSEIYRADPGTMRAEQISSRFPGNILNLYYYEGEQKLYGEYTPVSWRSCYGQIVSVDMDGTVTLIDDSLSRGSSDKNKNELLILLMVNENMVTTYLRTCEYNAAAGTWSVLSEKPYQFADTMHERVAGSVMGSADETEQESTKDIGEEEQETETSPVSAENDPPPTSRPEESSKEESRENRTSQAPSTEAERPATRPAAPSETSPSRPPVQEPEETAPALPERPAEPGYAPTTQAQEGPGPGNSGTIPTIEANPESNIGPGPGGSPSESVWYIGP